MLPFKRAVYKEHEEFIQMIREGMVVDVTDIERRTRIFELKIKICYFFEIWFVVQVISICILVKSFIDKRDILFLCLFTFFWLVFGIFRLMEWKQKLNRLSADTSRE